MNKELLNHLSNKTILYVEDDKSLRDNVISYLKLLFESVQIAQNGIDGLESFKTKKIDVVLSDLDMPGINGIEMIKKIREINKETPIIIMTAHTDPKYLIEAVELNLVRYLTKPFVGDELLGALEKIYIQDKNNNEIKFRLSDNSTYNLAEKIIEIDSQKITLTLKEAQLLELFLEKKGKLVAFSEIESKIWYDSYMTAQSLRTLVKKLRKKLPPNIIENVVGYGYKISF